MAAGITAICWTVACPIYSAITMHYEKESKTEIPNVKEIHNVFIVEIPSVAEVTEVIYPELCVKEASVSTVTI